MTKFEELEARLSAMKHSSNITCRAFTKLLKDFGFHIRDGQSGGHKVVSHPGLHGFLGANYNCGHNPGVHVKPHYIKQITKIVTAYSVELKELLK